MLNAIKPPEQRSAYIENNDEGTTHRAEVGECMLRQYAPPSNWSGRAKKHLDREKASTYHCTAAKFSVDALSERHIQGCGQL